MLDTIADSLAKYCQSNEIDSIVIQPQGGEHLLLACSVKKREYKRKGAYTAPYL